MDRSKDSFPSTVNIPLDRTALPGDTEKNLLYGGIYHQYLKPLSILLASKLGVVNAEAEEIAHAFMIDRFYLAENRDRFLKSFQLWKEKHPSGRFRWYLATAVHRYALDSRGKTGVPGGRVGTDERLEEVPEGSESGDSDSDIAYEDACALHTFGEALDACRSELSGKGRGDDLWRLLELRILEPLRTGAAPPDLQELGNQLGGISPAKVSALFVTTHRALNRHLVKAIARWNDLEKLDSQKEKLDCMDDSLRTMQRVLGRYANHQQLQSMVHGVSGNFVMLGTRWSLRHTDLVDQTSALWTLHIESTLSANIDAWREFDVAMKTAAWPELGKDASVTLGQFFGSPSPSIPILQAIRDFGKRAGQAYKPTLVKRRMTENDDEQCFLDARQRMFEGLYLVAIAVARVRHSRKLTHDDDSKFLKLFTRLLNEVWLDEANRSVVRDWLKSFGGTSAS